MPNEAQPQQQPTVFLPDTEPATEPEAAISEPETQEQGQEVPATDVPDESQAGPETEIADDNQDQSELAPEEAAAPEDSATEEAAAPEVAFSWQASEFVHNHKSAGWYAILALMVIVLTGLAVWLQLWLAIAVFPLMGVAVVVYARKPPRTLLYELSDQGVQIDGRLLPYADFRSFGVIPDEEWHSIDLEPAKRLNPRTVLLFNQEDFESIVGHLEIHLPREDRELDMIERITRFVRF